MGDASVTSACDNTAAPPAPVVVLLPCLRFFAVPSLAVLFVLLLISNEFAVPRCLALILQFLIVLQLEVLIVLAVPKCLVLLLLPFPLNCNPAFLRFTAVSLAAAHSAVLSCPVFGTEAAFRAGARGSSRRGSLLGLLFAVCPQLVSRVQSACLQQEHSLLTVQPQPCMVAAGGMAAGVPTVSPTCSEPLRDPAAARDSSRKRGLLVLKPTNPMTILNLDVLHQLMSNDGVCMRACMCIFASVCVYAHAWVAQCLIFAIRMFYYMEKDVAYSGCTGGFQKSVCEAKEQSNIRMQATCRYWPIITLHSIDIASITSGVCRRVARG
eukprot:1159499-Pelagomonas_calceolata.AAC.9